MGQKKREKVPRNPHEIFFAFFLGNKQAQDPSPSPPPPPPPPSEREKERKKKRKKGVSEYQRLTALDFKIS